MLPSGRREESMSDRTVRVLESVADLLCGMERLETAELVRAVARDCARKESEIERLRVANANLHDALRQWNEKSRGLQECLREIGSDGSVYESVFDEAVGVLTHWRTMIDAIVAKAAGGKHE
jgi:hypothetical protein